MTRWPARVGLVLLAVGMVPCLARADDTAAVEELRATVRQQGRFIQQLTEQLARLEAQLAGALPAPASDRGPVSLEPEELSSMPSELARTAPPPRVAFGGYVDIGYVEPSGSGTVSTSALQVNSRGDTLSTLGLDGDSSFLVNEVNLDARAAPAPGVEAVTNVALLPRKLSITSSGGSVFTDAFEVNQAYLAYEPFLEASGPVTEALFGDLKLSIGKFDSPMGLEYRYNKSPERVNISRSMMAIYWTGYPVGLKMRGKLFKEPLDAFRHSVLTYNLAVANGEPWVTHWSGAR